MDEAGNRLVDGLKARSDVGNYDAWVNRIVTSREYRYEVKDALRNLSKGMDNRAVGQKLDAIKVFDDQMRGVRGSSDVKILKQLMYDYESYEAYIAGMRKMLSAIDVIGTLVGV